MAEHPVHVFLNPTAGRGRAGRRQARIVELLGASGAELVVHRSEAVGDLEERVRAEVEKGALRIVVAGGDGSIHEAVNGILPVSNEAALGVVPTGTGNDFAKACDIPLNWEHAVRLLADRLAAQQPLRTIDIGTMNGRYFANGAGIGLDARVTRIARAYRIPIGDLVYLLAIFRSMLGSIATPQLDMRAEGVQWSGRATLASISNGPWIGGMFHIAPMAANDDGRLELVIADPVTRRRIVTLLPKLMSGDHIGEAEIHHLGVERVTIVASEPVDSHLDGEVQPLQTRFEVEILPRALRLL